MRQQNHQDRLKAFAALILPIARALHIEAKSEVQSAPLKPSAVLSSAPDLQASFTENQGVAAQNSSDTDSSFFNSISSESEFKPVGLHEPLAGETNRRCELVRQELIQFQHSQFSSLPLKTQMMAKVGGLLYLERMNLEHRTYHLVCDGQLIGMFDRKRESLYVRQDSPLRDFSDLHCVTRPDTARRDATGLELVQIHDCVWLYAAHDPEALLDVSPQVGTHLLSLRRLPKVSPSLLTDSQMILIRQLLLRPKRFDELSQGNTRNQLRRLMRDIACMTLTKSLEFTAAASSTRAYK
jgi:hypothetical protein